MPENTPDRGIFVRVTYTTEWTTGHFLGDENTVHNTEELFMPEMTEVELIADLASERFIWGENETGEGDYINLAHVLKIAVIPVAAA